MNTSHRAYSKQEIHLQFNDIFFSKTDNSGKILFGNSTFTRISGYEWHELLHKAHSIVRHPDMPRTVFYLLWAYLKEAKPISAYVKNRAKNGAFYWVFASAFPMENSITSVSIKPNPETVKIVEKLYAKMLLIEQEDSQNGMNKAAEYLLIQLKALGFNSYDHFMSCSMLNELDPISKLFIASKANTEKLSHANSYLADLCHKSSESSYDLFQNYKCTCSEFDRVEQQLNEIEKTLSDLEFCSINMSLQASKLGATAKSLHIIAGNFGVEARKIHQCIGEIKQAYTQAREAVSYQAYSFATMLEQFLVLETFTLEASQQSCQEIKEKHFQEAEELRTLIEVRLSKTNEGTKKLSELTHILQKAIDTLSRLIRRVEGIYQMGSVEITRCEGNTKSLKSQLEDLKLVSKNTSDQVLVLNEALKKIVSRFEVILNRVPELEFSSKMIQESLIKVKIESVNDWAFESQKIEKGAA